MKQDHYETTIEEIKKLIKTNPEEAIKKLEIELNMPYIPKKYESEFNELLNDIRYKLKQDSEVNNELSNEEVLEIIFKNDKVKMPMAIAKLKDFNLRPMTSKIQEIINNKNITNIVKTIIYEYCVEQEIDFNFSWNNKEINPKNIGSTIMLKAYKDAYFKIENIVAQDPSLQNVAYSYLELYVLNTFPEFINEKEDLGDIIISIAYESIGIPQINKPNANRLNEVKKHLYG